MTHIEEIQSLTQQLESVKAEKQELVEALEDIARGPLQGPGNFELYVVCVAEQALAKHKGQ